MNLASKPSDASVPLAVDVDGTLLRTDLLHEAALQFVARHPIETPKLLGWAAGGKANLKSQLADRVDPVIETLPLRTETLDLIRRAQAEGRPVFLASASDHRYVSALAERIGGIAGVFATTPDTNLAGAAKARALVDAFGDGGFDYAGDMPVDIAVWGSARRQIVIAHNRRFEGRVRRAFPAAEVIARPRPRRHIKALRVHQWAKNALIFLPLVAGHQLRIESIAATMLAFACFCMAASSAYILNDLLDLPGDRDHPRKRNRPFAAGDVPVTHGLALSLLLMGAALGCALLLPDRFLVVLLSYVAATLAYSFVLKRKAIVDVIVLGGLYTIRVFAGLAAVGAKTSPWLLMFSLFLFLSLAILKRCAELVQRREAGKGDTVGRGYRIDDAAALFPLAAAAGYGAVLVFTLYMASPEVMELYRHPHRLWLLCPLLLYWISRVLILAHRNELHDDPVVFTLTDRVSWVTGGLVAAVIAVAI